MLDGSTLPSWEKLASYIFFTATGEEFDPGATDREKWFVGRSRLYDVYLMYADDVEVLKDMALTLPIMRGLPPTDRRKLVFAPTKYVDQELLHQERIVFQQLPFEIYESADRLAP